MDENLFRQQAKSAYYGADVRGRLLTIAPPSSIALFAGLTLLFIVLVAFASFGHAAVYAEGRGVVRPTEPPLVIHAPFSGTVLEAPRGSGTRGKAGELLLSLDARAEETAHATCTSRLDVETRDLAGLEQRLAAWNDASSREREAAFALVLIAQVRAQRDKVTTLTQRCQDLEKFLERSRLTFPADAGVDDLAVGPGTQVREGDVLATLVPASARLVVYLALPEQYRSEVVVGRPARLKFDALPFDAVGVGNGTVQRLLDSLPSGVKTDAADGSGVYAQVSIDAMPKGAAAPRAGMTLTGDVLAERGRIIDLLFAGPAQ